MQFSPNRSYGQKCLAVGNRVVDKSYAQGRQTGDVNAPDRRTESSVAALPRSRQIAGIAASGREIRVGLRNQYFLLSFESG
jgi:hypothetical protein